MWQLFSSPFNFYCGKIKITTFINIKTDAFLNEKEPVTEASTIGDKFTTEAIEPEVVTENKAQNTATANKQSNQGMKEKYPKLLEHNSQLLEILRATMEVQSVSSEEFSNTCSFEETSFALFSDIRILK